MNVWSRRPSHAGDTAFEGKCPYRAVLLHYASADLLPTGETEIPPLQPNPFGRPAFAPGLGLIEFTKRLTLYPQPVVVLHGGICHGGEGG